MASNYKDKFFDQHSKINYINCLLLQGYTSKIIEFETGFSSKRIRKIRGELLNHDHEYFAHAKSSKSAKAASSKTIVSSVEDQLRASILMLIYRRMHSDYQHSVDCVRLALCFGQYMQVLNHENCFLERNKITSVNHAWSLAQELRSNESWFTDCDICGHSYFESVNQSRYVSNSTYCPWCSFGKSHYRHNHLPSKEVA